MAGAQDLALMQAMLPYAQPATYPTIRRSQYLADALENLQESGRQPMRSPVALFGNLAGTALLQGAREQNSSKLNKQLRGDMGGVVDALSSGVPGMPQLGGPMPQSGGMPIGAPSPQGPPSVPGQMPALVQQAPLPDVGAQPMPSAEQGGMTMQPIPPQLVQEAQRLRAEFTRTGSPMIMERYLKLVDQMRGIATTPIDPSKPAWVPDGNGGFVVRDYGKAVTSRPGPKPGTMIQTRDATGEIEIKDTGIMGTPEPGSVYDPSFGGFAKLPTTVGGRNMPFGAMSPEQVNTVVKKISDGKQVTNYMTLRSKAASALMPEGPENNATDLNLIDVANTALANNPDLAVSEGFFKTVQEAQGGMNKFIADLRNNVTQNGLLNQEYRNRLKKVIAASLHHRYDAAKQEIDTYRPGLEAIGLGDQADAVLAQLAPPIEYKPSGMPASAPGGGPMPPASASPGSFTPPPAKAVEFLRNNPQTAAAFDAKYGAGAARQILGGR